MNNSKTICEYPWTWVSFNVDYGMWRTCPRSPYKWFQTEDEASDFFNVPEIVKIRDDLYNGRRNSSCVDCYTAEDKGGMSYRKALKKDREVENAHQTILEAPKVIELKFSNLCNLKCVFCANFCSSLWEHEVPIPAEITANQKVSSEFLSNTILDWIDKNFDKVESIMFLGGEPAIQKQFYQVADIFLSKDPDKYGSKELTFSTNTFYPEVYRNRFESTLTKVLERGHTVFPRLSLDGIGNKQTYQRTNLKWQQFENNMLSFLEKFNTSTKGIKKIRANIALNILNLVYCDEIVHYLADIGYSDIQPHYNYIVKPDMFYMRHWGSKLNDAIDIINKQDFLGQPQYKEHITKMASSFTNLEPNIDHIRNTKKWIDDYDAKYGYNFAEIFPDNRYLFDGV